MTSISAWLAAEEPDKNEPAGFYAPGAANWDDPSVAMTRARLRRRHNLAVEEFLRVAAEMFDEE